MKNSRLGLVLLTIALALMVIVPTAVYAYTYRAPLTITENGTANRGMIGLMVNSNNLWMSTNGYMSASGNDTRVGTLSASYYPWLITDTRTLTAATVAQGSQTNLFLTTGETPSAMNIITGYNGYYTVNDTAPLEMGSSFVFNTRRYIDTTAGADKYIVSKQDAIDLLVSPTTSGTITAEITQTGSYANNTNNVAIELGASFSTRAGTLEAAHANSITITSVIFALKKTGTPAGTASITVRNSATDALIGTLGTKDVTLLTTSFVNYTFNTPVTVPAGTGFRVLVEFSAADRLDFGRANSDIMTGTYTTYLGAYATDATKDVTMTINYKENILVSVTGVASGEKTVTASLTGGNFTLDIDGTSNTTAFAGSVPDNANNYIFSQSNVSAYTVYDYLTISGVEKLHLQPISMIIGNKLPDRDGTKDADITWGSNPTGTSVVLSSMTSSYQAAVSSGSNPSRSVLQEVPGHDPNAPPDVSGSLLTNPMRPFVLIMTYGGSMTESQAWIYFGLLIMVAACATVAFNVKGHQGITAAVASVVNIALVVMTIWPWWTLFFIAIYIFGGWVSERSPSL